MRTLLSLCTIIFVCLIASCNSGNDDNVTFHMDKKYWTADDYNDIQNTLYMRATSQKELPNLSNPQTAPIFNKLIDTNNVFVGAGDPQLGLSTRNAFAEKMFELLKQLIPCYATMDREDKYKYPMEYVALLKFDLYVQSYYIPLGNEKIVKESDNPNAPDVVSLLDRNRQVLIDNYNLYLDHINNEDRFNDDALSMYADGIHDYFTPLITTFAPEGDYREMSARIDNMLLKAKNKAVIKQLQDLKALIIDQQANRKKVTL